jgi:hypothetical protein
MTGLRPRGRCELHARVVLHNRDIALQRPFVASLRDEHATDKRNGGTQAKSALYTNRERVAQCRALSARGGQHSQQAVDRASASRPCLCLRTLWDEQEHGDQAANEGMHGTSDLHDDRVPSRGSAARHRLPGSPVPHRWAALRFYVSYYIIHVDAERRLNV